MLDDYGTSHTPINEHFEKITIITSSKHLVDFAYFPKQNNNLKDRTT